MAVKVTKVGNGLLFDMSTLEGSGSLFASKSYFPLTAIEQISLYTDKVTGYDVTGENWDMTITGEGASYQISEVGGITVTTVEEIFTNLIALVY